MHWSEKEMSIDTLKRALYDLYEEKESCSISSDYEYLQEVDFAISCVKKRLQFLIEKRLGTSL